MKRMSLILNLAVLAIVGVASAYLLPFQAVGVADAQGPLGPVGVWHRLNPDQGNPTPEHEVLSCGGNARWHCIYDKHPEPRLGFEHPPDSTFGQFRGENITSGWSCPDWFEDKCDATVFVAGGVMNFQYPDGSYLDVDQELVVIDQGAQQVLYVYWVESQFACPWYMAFDQALLANPFSTPFNGTDWPDIDCIFPQ
jgi:hypothetical protein